jgi:hypothetical protein
VGAGEWASEWVMGDVARTGEMSTLAVQGSSGLGLASQPEVCAAVW